MLVIRELPDTTLVRPLTPVPDGFELKEFMYEYFQLDYSLKDLYQEWSQLVSCYIDIDIDIEIIMMNGGEWSASSFQGCSE